MKEFNLLQNKVRVVVKLVLSYNKLWTGQEKIDSLVQKWNRADGQRDSDPFHITGPLFSPTSCLAVLTTALFFGVMKWGDGFHTAS